MNLDRIFRWRRSGLADDPGPRPSAECLPVSTFKVTLCDDEGRARLVYPGCSEVRVDGWALQFRDSDGLRFWIQGPEYMIEETP